MLTVRTPVRSTPRTHEATSAMSAVCTCTSSVAGSEMSGALSPPARCTARRGPVGDHRAGDLRVQVLRAEPGEGLLDHHPLRAGEERIGLPGGLPDPR